MPSYFDELKKAKAFYDIWRKEITYSPALKCNVQVSLKGWYHITGSTGSKKRSINDKYRRIKLLPIAKDILLKATTVQNITVKHKRKYFAIESMEEITINNTKQLCKVRVLLIEDKNGNKIFYSVMDKKII